MSHPLDRRFMAAAIRLSRKHLGLTATNPSVATLIVKDGVIVGRSVTALGGRPHAEAQALAEAGELARGATAYVTLEPCAHHGRTPPCAEALVEAGIARVVGAASDPDPRVSGRGYEILREAQLMVTEGVLAAEAGRAMSGYLTRSMAKRPEVTLKLAVSADGMIGRASRGNVAITGIVARRQVHAMRAETDIIAVGIGTVLADDPDLTCRLPGLGHRSPIRLVLDPALRIPLDSRLVRSAQQVPVWVAAGPDVDSGRRTALEAAGVRLIGAELVEGRIALPELLEDLGALGYATLMLEGGAKLARAFLAENLVDRLALFEGEGAVGTDGIASPVTRSTLPSGFSLVEEAHFGRDSFAEYEKVE